MNIDETVANFDRDGYVLLPQAICPEELAVLQEDSAYIMGLIYSSSPGNRRRNMNVQ